MDSLKMILHIGLSAEPFQTQVALKLWFDAALVPLMLGQVKFSFVLFPTLGALKLSLVYNKNDHVTVLSTTLHPPSAPVQVHSLAPLT